MQRARERHADEIRHEKRVHDVARGEVRALRAALSHGSRRPLHEEEKGPRAEGERQERCGKGRSDEDGLGQKLPVHSPLVLI